MTRRFTFDLLLSLFLLGAASTLHATERPLSPYERIAGATEEMSIDVTDADANELILQVLERSGLQYTFIRSGEERLLSLVVKAQPVLALETIAYAAGFNIHKNGNYWVVHPLALQEDAMIE